MKRQNESQEIGLQQVLTRRLGIAGQSSPAPTLQPELVGTLVLENDRPEWNYLKGEFLYGFAVPVGAVAAEYGHVYVVNFSTTNIVVVKKVTTSFTGAVNFYTARAAVIKALTGAAQQTGAPMDSRIYRAAGTSRAQAYLEYGTHATLTALGNRIHRQPNGWLQPFDQPIMLGPGSFLEIIADTVNVALQVSVQFSERPLVQGENF